MAAVAVNATSVDKDAKTLKKDVEVQQTSIKGQESGDVKNVGLVCSRFFYATRATNKCTTLMVSGHCRL